MSLSHTRLLAAGHALPTTCLTNAQLVAQLAERGIETSADWIETRTGITQRYVVGEGENTATLARAAVENALHNAGLTAADVDVLLVATCTPNLTFPSTAAILHGQLGLKKTATVLDVNAACSGFIHALAVAQGLLKPGQTAVVVGAECFSKVVDWADRTTCVLFGDGAGAVILRAEAAPQQSPRGILGVELGADGTLAEALFSTGGVATTGTAGAVAMQGREVFKHAVRQMGQAAHAGGGSTLKACGKTVNEIDWLVPHQANVRILEAAAAGLGLPLDKVIITAPQHANTSAASIPLALSVAVADGRIKPGQLLLLQAFGAGFVWSEAAVVWG
jgi:3-oxoacyl-[acyl-carrier-protein] synthase III